MKRKEKIAWHQPEELQGTRLGAIRFSWKMPEKLRFGLQESTIDFIGHAVALLGAQGVAMPQDPHTWGCCQVELTVQGKRLPQKTQQGSQPWKPGCANFQGGLLFAVLIVLAPGFLETDSHLVASDAGIFQDRGRSS